MQEPEERPAGHALELLVTRPVQQVLGVNDVGRVGDLDARKAERRARRPEAEEGDVHRAALHRPGQKAADFRQALFALDAVEVRAEARLLRDHVPRDFLVAALVLVPVEVGRVAGGGQGDLLAVFDGLAADVIAVGLGVGDDADGGGAAEFGGIGHESREARVLERFQGGEILGVEFAFQNGCVLRVHERLTIVSWARGVALPQKPWHPGHA